MRGSGLVAGTWGNISIRVDSENMVITPSGIDYENAMPNDVAAINIRTMEWEGDKKPSSEAKLHAQIFKERKNINAIIHTHSMNASTVAAARRDVPPILDDMAQIIGSSIRVAKYALPSTQKIVRETVKALKGRNAALMANHGAIGIGRDIEEAFTVCEV